MRLRRPLAFTMLALAAAAIGAFYYLSPPSPPSQAATPFGRAATPKEMPALEFQDDAGRAHSLAEFKGKVVLLNLWATWCAPCREEMPALDRLQAELGGPRFQVVALSVDQQGAPIARKFLAEAGVNSLALYFDPSAQAAFKLGAAGLPASLLVDANGREVARHLGPAKWDSPEVVSELRRRIETAR
jgi:thiol-disulfide isomerase/thioredoxin